MVVSKGSATTLFRTTDRGAGWSIVSDSLSFRPQAILFQPGKDSIVYAVDGRVFRSTDRGQTWSQLSTPVGTVWSNLGFSATDSNGVWLAGYSAASARGRAATAVSTDSGMNWNVFDCDSVMRSSCHSIALASAHDSVIYCGGSVAGQAVVYKSTDKGSSWTRHNLPTSAMWDSVGLCSPPPQENPVGGRVQFLYIDPTNPNILLAAMTWYGVFRSTDAGATWTHYSGIHEAHSLAYVPLQPEIVFVGATNGLYKTADAGASWSGPYQPPYGGLVGCVLVPGDVNNEALAGTGTAVFRTIDQGQSWDPFSILDTADVTALEIVRTAPQYLYTAIAGAGVFRSTNSGDGWSQCRGFPGSDSVVSIAAASATQVWALADSGLYYSTDGGGSWVSEGDWFDDAGAVSVSPVDSRFVVATGRQFGSAQTCRFAISPTTDTGQACSRPPPRRLGGLTVLVTTDRGISWSYSMLCPGGMGRAVALSPTDWGRVLVAGDSAGSAVAFTNHDAGSSWSRTGSGLTGIVKSMEFSPTSGNLLMCGTTDGAFQSSDNGNNWHYTGLSHVNATAYLPTYGWQFAGADSGVFEDQGSGWAPWSYGLVDSDVVSMVVADWNLYAGTRTAGLFRGYVPSGIDDRPAGTPMRPSYAGPTIIRNAIILRDVSDGRHTCLMDACGRRIMAFHAGTNDIHNLSPGVYFVRERLAVGGERSTVRKVVITR